MGAPVPADRVAVARAAVAASRAVVARATWAQRAWARAAAEARRRAGWSKLERLCYETAAWRCTLEIRLVGAMLQLPRVGLAQAERAGVTAELFERPDAWRMYLAIRCGAAAGWLDDRTRVLVMVRHVLRADGYWDPRAPARDRGLRWSDYSLVNLACGGADGDTVADVGLYAAQLLDLDRRLREARACWGRMVETLEGVGELKAEG